MLLLSEIANLERRGQFIINRLFPQGDDDYIIGGLLFQISNGSFDTLLKAYDEYLIKNGVCPKCYSDLVEPDKMYEEIHCHKCLWMKSEDIRLRQ